MDHLNTYSFRSRQVFLYIASLRSIQKEKAFKFKSYHCYNLVVYGVK